MGTLEGTPFEEVVHGVRAQMRGPSDSYIQQQAIESVHEVGGGVTGGVEEGR